MAKPIKKKFFEVDIPLLNEKYEAQAHEISQINGKTIKMDLTRQLRGKSVEAVFAIELKDNKLSAIPKKIVLLPYFIKHMLHTGIDYVEDSFTAESKESNLIIKPFLITRKKVSRAVRNTLRNSAKNWLQDYTKTKTDYELFQEILSNQLQKPLSLRLKKVYPLAICEIRVLEVKKPLTSNKQ
jgi:ribosomal protein S3AE